MLNILKMLLIYFCVIAITYANNVMPWIYSTNVDCGGLTSRYNYIIQHKDYFSIVAPTVYYVSNEGNKLNTWSSGCNSTTLEEFSMKFPLQNIEVFPHVAYDSVNITALRNGILNDESIQDEYITTLIDKSTRFNYTGYSLDLFPNDDELGYIQYADGQSYADFVDKFSGRLHKIGKQLRVYAEPGDLFSNIELLTQTSVDLIITQAYEYKIDIGQFRDKLFFALHHVKKEKLGIGLCPSCLSHEHFTKEALMYRFQLLLDANITQLGIWASGVPDSWLPFLSIFLH
jgi:hypothetical protein